MFTNPLKTEVNDLELSIEKQCEEFAKLYLEPKLRQFCDHWKVEFFSGMGVYLLKPSYPKAKQWYITLDRKHEDYGLSFLNNYDSLEFEAMNKYYDVQYLWDIMETELNGRCLAEYLTDYKPKQYNHTIPYGRLSGIQW